MSFTIHVYLERGVVVVVIVSLCAAHYTVVTTQCPQLSSPKNVYHSPFTDLLHSGSQLVSLKEQDEHTLADQVALETK